MSLTHKLEAYVTVYRQALISEIGLIREICGSESFWFWPVPVG